MNPRPKQRTQGFFAAVLHVVYGLYAWIAFLFCVVFSALITLLVPGLHRRRRWVTATARSFFQVVGISSTVNGLEKLPPGHCIAVANHASYVDGVILQAYLPPRFSYVIKGEMRNVPVAHFLLRRIGAKFVERFVTTGSARDARSLLKAAASGESLAFFPEGTFIAEAGLGKFRNGAFAAAIKSELPIVPIVIRGSRHILPCGHILPRRGPLELDIIQPIHASDPSFSSAAALAEESRQRILGLLDEPDLLIAART